MTDGNFDAGSEFLQSFVAESQELLDQVEPCLIELQQSCEATGSVDKETLNSVFRLFHSMKGNASFLCLENTKNVTHEAEALLNLFREGKIELDSSHTDLLCRTCDLIRNFLLNIEAHGNDKGFESETRAIVEELHKACILDSSRSKTPSSNPLPEPSSKDRVSDSACSPSAIPPTSDRKLQFSITSEMTTHFVQESDELLQGIEQALLDIEKNPNKAELLATAFRHIHSFKGNCGFLGFSDLERLSHQMETVLDYMKTSRITATESNIEILLDIVDVLRNGVAKVAEGKSGDIQDCDLMLNLLDEMIPIHLKDAGPPRLGEILIAHGDATPEAVQSALNLQKKHLGKNLEEQGTGNHEAINSAIAEHIKQETIKITRRDIRVNLDKLDLLNDLVGELVIAQSMVIHNPDLAGHEFNNFEKAAHHLERITSELRDVSMSVRMIPIAGIFRKMIRLVHDLSKKSGKRVNLEIVGEETEVDKTVIEQISDPLVHIIRNCVDHGIETVKERRDLGKNETGTITLEAKHDGGEVWITIRDDGRGLDRDRILAKAIEQGLVENEKTIHDEDIFKLIFEPGFSTADKVTDISGRGVGMDVVKKNIDKLKGRVDLQSKPGQGTTVILRIPLTLAIMDSMLVRVGTQRYTIPLLAIKELFRCNSHDITVIPGGQEVVRNHGVLFPVIRLHKVFSVDADHAQLDKGILITVDHQERAVCLFADEVLGQRQAVIKGLSEYHVKDARGVSGCTILGDGTVSLILDIKGIVEKAVRDNQVQIGK